MNKVAYRFWQQQTELRHLPQWQKSMSAVMEWSGVYLLYSSCYSSIESYSWSLCCLQSKLQPLGLSVALNQSVSSSLPIPIPLFFPLSPPTPIAPFVRLSSPTPTPHPCILWCQLGKFISCPERDLNTRLQKRVIRFFPLSVFFPFPPFLSHLSSSGPFRLSDYHIRPSPNVRL